MAIFITLRCEGRGEGRSEFGKYRCWSDDNDDPYVLAGDTKKDAYLSLEDLFTDAKSAGWKKLTGDGCARHASLLKQQRGRTNP
ncbi:hypothetical protein ACWKX5_06565 [Enterobacter asburiae]